MARLLVVVFSETDPSARLGDWLREAGLDLDERRLHTGDRLPADLAGHDGLLVLGGQQSAGDGPDVAPELVGVRALLRAALDSDVPTLGICLGAQLLAHVGGGRVQVGRDGPEIGATLVAKRDVAEHDPLFGPVPLTPDVIEWHNDEIAELPPGATLLASSARYPNQAFRLGRHVYGLQFHIETDPELVRRWAAEDAAGIATTPFDAATVAARAAEVHPDMAEVWAPFAGRFADLVRARAGATA
ncbi:type 1 glutamine amidotransferase [Geodermatophilus ruber]|uniref:GMP synthase-Glutamine amidotransferase n=1 Tax=Geodermatophilus ruber TaxID=504800 RepID=A0A1I4AN45_9ACTN|nr:type 1 glutamine amidotransferase [Geodermatophilus ruber]SFK57942.1 GMP synthase-Glutamine amidotransferase [Geodermatophilus ruber]